MNHTMNAALLELSLVNLPGEKWKPIPGFDGRYQLSNYGRTKALIKTPRIMKPHVGKVVQIELQNGGKRNMITIPRMVYHLFVKPIETSDKKSGVQYKDGNKLNCHYRNLVFKTLSTLAKESYADGSRRNNFRDQSKPVSQYDSDGLFIAQFPSAVHATTATGIPRFNIYAAVYNKGMSGGFYWRYGPARKKIRIRRTYAR